MTTRETSESPIEHDIVRVGREGDGVAADGKYLPFTLAGERVRLDPLGHGTPDILTPSADRVTPPCPHFGTCGGCALQHWAHEPYLAWKREQVMHALLAEGLDAAVDPVRPGVTAGRRRVTMTARPTPQGVRLGFHERASDALIDLGTCHVATPGIARRLPAFRALLARLRLKKEAQLVVLDAANGFDLSVTDARPPSSAQALAVVTEICRRARIRRLTVEGEPLVMLAAPELSMGERTAFPPPGAFTQAVAEVEAEMADLVMAAVGKATRVAELHAGIGTFTLRLAAQARVTAYETDGAAVDALRFALLNNKGLKPSEAVRRDLHTAPLAAAELKKVDAVVLDPPRAGAAAQMPALAEASSKRIAYVSCNPRSFARDAAVLVAGGYRLTRVTPLDQFVWSPHIELVAAFER